MRREKEGEIERENAKELPSFHAFLLHLVINYVCAGFAWLSREQMRLRETENMN